MAKAKQKFKAFQYEDGREVDVAYMDGYLFGDTLLEGVVFKVEITEGNLVVSFLNPRGEYESGLNQKKWLKEAKRFAEGYDIFQEKDDLTGDLALLPLE